MIKKMKQFIFLYPIPEFIDFEIENYAWSEKEESDAFRKRYKITLNKCIDTRYRQKGFEINYAVFDKSPISRVIEFKQLDKVIEVGLDFKTHKTKQSDGKYPYLNQDHILNQLNKTHVIRIAGFHMWDCVEKLAKRAYERKLDVLVDEDLTEFFCVRLRDPDFKIDKYPTYNPRKHQESMFNLFTQVRKEKPWLWQDY